MCGRTVTRWLVLLAGAVLALGHGFAGAATHLPGHPGHTLWDVPMPRSAPAHHDDGTPPGRHGTAGGHGSHDEDSCEVLGNGGTGPHPPSATAGPSAPGLAVRASAAPPAGGAPCRSPPRSRLAVLSVLRI
ncbi:DUF6153 family protein [Streptomyces sp. YIM 98790]|uniref:DUF6153 family protein n=1 Tax=Streptomyces sp. YIM 98790 TaxID=2689077 RepID=UPI001A9D4A7A|nr:DUF6153 family protein [Streptomyces sp. YIM 98790]